MDDGFAGFRIGVAGLGLIGGSLARAFKSAGFYVCGYDFNNETVDAAVKCGAVNEASCEPDSILSCDCIFLALYPDGIVNFIKEHLYDIKKGAVVIDCCGIKSKLCNELFAVTQGADFKFIGGHPMAGTEQNGFSASFAQLFEGASFILTPRDGKDSVLVQKLSKLISFAGFGRVIVTTPEHHDRMIAFTSQLPHIIACAYVMSPSCPQHEGFSAGSFRDVSRVAHINPTLWTELFTGNNKELCEEIDLMIENMTNIRNAMASGDTQTLTALLQKAREIKDNV